MRKNDRRTRGLSLSTRIRILRFCMWVLIVFRSASPASIDTPIVMYSIDSMQNSFLANGDFQVTEGDGNVITRGFVLDVSTSRLSCL